MWLFQTQRKVSLIGENVGIGQPLSLLLKLNENISCLALHSDSSIVGTSIDLSHCNSPARVTGNSNCNLLIVVFLNILFCLAHEGTNGLDECLNESDIVILIPSGFITHSCQSPSSINHNKSIFALLNQIAKYCGIVILRIRETYLVNYVMCNASSILTVNK